MDPVDGWRELREHDAHLSEEGLQAAADEPYDLTEIARSVLRNEIQSRRLDGEQGMDGAVPHSQFNWR